jgi:DNA-binding response OmpR family regulator
MKVLIVEDEQRMAQLLERGLEREGYSVLIARDGREGLELARSADPDLVILDVMLPRINGFEVARKLRSMKIRQPILMLTARDMTADIVRGLDSGADDYLTKPFPFAVLLARLRALARREPVARPPVLGVADLRLDPASRRVERDGQIVPLSRREFDLLEALMRRAGQVVPRSELIGSVWGFEGDIESNTLDAFMRLLRRKVDPPRFRKLLHTIRGIGYTVREDEIS